MGIYSNEQKLSDICPSFKRNSMGFAPAGIYDVPGPLVLSRGMKNLDAGIYVWDDFYGIAEGYNGWILNSGSDGSAVDPAQSLTVETGAIDIVTGAGDGSTAQDGSQIICGVPMQVDSGGLVFECRLTLAATTNVQVNAGFTDVTTLEEPFTVSGTTITNQATDAVCFTYDTAMTTDAWWAIATDGGTDDAGSGTTSVAPTATTYQTLRIEFHDLTGTDIRFFVDGVLTNTLTGAGVSPDVNLYATVIACGDSTASKTVTVDYMYFGCKKGGRTWYHHENL